MVIGIDLDNTIICYDRLFSKTAVDLGLIPSSTPPGKLSVKTEVLARHGNEVWTELQARVYGPSLSGAEPFPGVEEAVRRFRGRGWEVVIISHKTRFPALGPRCDLRVAAMDWLEGRGWFGAGMLEAREGSVEFHDTRADKVHAIARRGCAVFVDDLPEVFVETGFPANTARILFDPESAHEPAALAMRFRSWPEIETAIREGLN